LSAIERRFAPYYKRLSKYLTEPRCDVSMVKESDIDRSFALAATFSGHRSMAAEKRRANLRRTPRNGAHLMLMALQVDRGRPIPCVMQDPFEPAREQQKPALATKFDASIRRKGRRIGGLPLAIYGQRLNEIMRSFEQDGCVVNNPHLQAGGWRPF
jgi:hypothetical protein